MDLHLLLTLRRLRQEIFQGQDQSEMYSNLVSKNKEIHKYINVTTIIGYDPLCTILWHWQVAHEKQEKLEKCMPILKGQFC